MWAMASRTLSSSVTSQSTNEHVPSGSSSACAALPGVAVHVGEHGGVAPAHERRGRGPADPRSGSGDEGHLRSCAVVHVGAPWVAWKSVDGEAAVPDDRSERLLGSGEQREVGERVAVDDDEVGQRTAVRSRRPGRADPPAARRRSLVAQRQDVGRRQAVDLGVEGELAAVVADLVVERVVLDQVRGARRCSRRRSRMRTPACCAIGSIARTWSKASRVTPKCGA